jgi:hypothetical protein
MAGLCVLLMGVFALMTVLVLAGSGNNTKLEGSVGYPQAGPLPDMLAPGASGSATHTAKHTTSSTTAAAGALETDVDSGLRVSAAVTGPANTAGSSSSSSGKTGSSANGGTPGKVGSHSTGGNNPGSGGKGSGGSGGKGSGGSGGGKGSGGSGGSGGYGGSGGSRGSSHTSRGDRAAYMRKLEQQLLAWRAQLLARQKEIAARLAQQHAHDSHTFPGIGGHSYTSHVSHPSHPAPSGHAYGRDARGDRHGR